MEAKELFIKEEIYYFTDKTKWEANTAKVVEIVKNYIERNNVKNIIVASSYGYTAVELVKALDRRDLNIVVVKMSKAVDDIYEVVFEPERKNFLDSRGIPLLAATHALTGAVDYAITERFKGLPPTTLIAETLYLFSQGMKVCVEVTMMAVDAGLVVEGEETIAIAGTGQGADTAIVVKAASSTNMFNLDIHKILAMPLQK